MLKTLKKFFAFCGADNRRLFMASIWLGVVSAICSAMRIPAVAIVIQALLQKNVTMATLWASLGGNPSTPVARSQRRFRSCGRCRRIWKF